jgi:hypothetical protein
MISNEIGSRDIWKSVAIDNRRVLKYVIHIQSLQSCESLLLHLSKGVDRLS